MKKKKIFTNVLSQSFGRTISYLLNFLSITMIARYFGVENFGIFTSTLAMVLIVSKLIDFGMGQIVFREVSKSKNFNIINNAITLRLFLSFLVLLLSNGLIFIFSFHTLEIILFNILFFNVYISSRFLNIRELLEIPFKVELNMHIVMSINLVDNLIFLLLVFIMPYVKGGLIYLALCYVAANLPGMILLFYYLNRKYKFKYHFYFDKSKWLIRESLPLFGYVLLLAVFQQLDLLILKKADSNFSAGIYSIAIRLTMPLSIIPIALITTAFPLLVKNIENNEAPNLLVRKIIYKILFGLTFSIFTFFVFKSKELIVLIFGQPYEEAYLPASVLFASNIILFGNYFTLDLLTINRKQIYNLFYAIIIVVVDIIVIIILLSNFGYTGVAIAKFVAIIVGGIFLFTVFKKSGGRILSIDIRVLTWS
ncbi:MAG: oligosaccharide flippase family protein, partial [Bacteroidetes bacterium]|nr:oligosaccharide flippase family protein [Bacteroidota bacterium]